MKGVKIAQGLFVTIFILCNLVHFIFGIIFIQTVPEYNYWIIYGICLAQTIISGINLLSSIGNMLAMIICEDEKKKSGTNCFSIMVMTGRLGIFIWSIVAYIGCNNDQCANYFSTNYHNLWLFFVISFWFNISMGLFAITLCCCAFFIGCCLGCCDSSRSSNVKTFPVNPKYNSGYV